MGYYNNIRGHLLVSFSNTSYFGTTYSVFKRFNKISQLTFKKTKALN